MLMMLMLRTSQAEKTQSEYISYLQQMFNFVLVRQKAKKASKPEVEEEYVLDAKPPPLTLGMCHSVDDHDAVF